MISASTRPQGRKMAGAVVGNSDNRCWRIMPVSMQEAATALGTHPVACLL